MPEHLFDAMVEYEDSYVQPLILEAIKSIAPKTYSLLPTTIEVLPETKLLQVRAYESIDFERCLQNSKSLCNAYIIRKALIRKHYLSNTVLSWTTKNPTSPLKKHFTPAEAFELDYAEFLDDALVEAFDLRAAFKRNEGKAAERREWWILKPGMSDRGQGIRLFSTEEELQSIFDEWEEEYSADNDEDSEEATDESQSQIQPQNNGYIENSRGHNMTDHIITSHLRHFIAQPYIHPPLLISQEPFANRKFHIRTYIVAAGALRVYVYSHMLALFASERYVPPWETLEPKPDADDDEQGDMDMLQRMRNIHLTNTCVQASISESTAENVYLLSSLPLTAEQHKAIQTQIHVTTAELFRAALSQPTNFQVLPNAFEIFGVDFLVEGGAGVNVQLLEVNAFPDFAQTGKELSEVVVQGLFEEVMKRVVCPFFEEIHINEEENAVNDAGLRSDSIDAYQERVTKVLDLDLGRR